MEKFPKTEHGIINRAQGMYGYKGWPTVTKDGGGRLYAVCSDYRMHHICPFGKTGMYISDDEGKTWSPPIIINDTALDDRDAGILPVGGKKLLMTWFTHPAELFAKSYGAYIKNDCSPDEALIALAQMASWKNLPEAEAKGGSYIRLSDDGGMTWGETIRVPVSAPHGPNILKDGSLIYLGKEVYSYGAEKPGAVAAYESKDSGLTWSRLCEIGVPEGFTLDNFHEPHVAEMPDGTLLGVIRAQGSPSYRGFTVFKCFSYDKGHTWTTPESLDVCGSPPHLLVHSSGAVICVFGRRETPYGERAAVSYDNGKTWPDEYVLFSGAPDGDLGYPSSVELADGSILTVYYQKYENDSKCSLMYTKWRL